MTGRLAGKVALVTGGSRGMGAAEAQLFAAQGAKVVIGDILEDEGQTLAKEIGDAAVFVRLDVTKEADWQSAIEASTEKFGHLNVLVNNAGIAMEGLLANTTLDDYRKVVEVNQTGVFLGMRAAYPSLCAAGGGSIVNISSIEGFHGSPNLGSYVASKFAVRGLTKVAALEWAADSIRVNSVHPGGISTPMVDNLPGITRAEAEALIGRLTPLGRIGQPIEVANMALFLASDESSFCTGAEFVVDGGATSGTFTALLDAIDV